MEGILVNGGDTTLSSCMLSELNVESDGSLSSRRQPIADLEKMVTHIKNLRPSSPLPRKLTDVRALSRLFDVLQQSSVANGNSHAAHAEGVLISAELEELLHLAVLLNDVDTRFLVLTPHLYQSISRLLAHYSSAVQLTDLPFQACILAMMPAIIHSSHLVLGKQGASEFLQAQSLQQYHLFALQQFGSSPIVLEHVHWLPYFLLVLRDNELPAGNQSSTSAAAAAATAWGCAWRGANVVDDALDVSMRLSLFVGAVLASTTGAPPILIFSRIPLSDSSAGFTTSAVSDSLLSNMPFDLDEGDCSAR
eukprot:scpid20250/ scgid32196/ 